MDTESGWIDSESGSPGRRRTGVRSRSVNVEPGYDNLRRTVGARSVDCGTPERHVPVCDELAFHRLNIHQIDPRAILVFGLGIQ